MPSTHWIVNLKGFKCFVEAEVTTYLTCTIRSVFWRVHCIPLSVQKKTYFLRSLSFVSLSVQVSALMASIAVLFWKVIYLQLFLFSDLKASFTLLADFTVFSSLPFQGHHPKNCSASRSCPVWSAKYL